MNLRKRLWPPGTVRADSGGVIANGVFQVRMRGFKLIYEEGDCRVTLPLEWGLDGSYNVGTALIRHWDDSSIPFDKKQMFTIQMNIFAALDCMKVHYTNIR